MQKGQFSRVDTFLIARIITVPPIEKNCPDNPDSPKQLEGASPGHVIKYRHNQKRRESTTPTGTHPHDALSPHAFLGGKPGGEGLGEVGKATGLTSTEEAPCYYQRSQVPNPPCGSGEKRPPDNNPHQNLACSHPISQPSSKDFEESVGPSESRKGIAHFNRCQPKIFGYGACCLRNADSVNIGNNCKGHSKHDNPIAGASGT